MTLGGSIFAHDAVRFDFCLREAIDSLCALCDHVVALDCESTDETLDLMHECAAKHSNLEVHDSGVWECAQDKERLRLLATQAKDLLPPECDWHFMLQADEVVHEASFPVIREAIAREDATAYQCRRLNLWGDYDHYVRLDSSMRPCGDMICRLGLRRFDAYGDAEALDAFREASRDLTDRIVIFHYGLVRDPAIMCDKCIEMQSWFFGPDGRPDPRIVAAKAEHGMFRPFDIIPPSELARIPMGHPVFMHEWLAERRPTWPYEVR
jgi:hypothetical protein